MSVIIELKDKKIKITDPLIELMNSYKQLNLKDYEAGGILIGKEIIETGNVIIEYATEPYPYDIRSRFSFKREDKKHVEIFNEKYLKDKIYAYMGEWHTHPEDFPNYSIIDFNNWRKIAKSNSDKDKIYYFIIVGTQAIRVWEYKQKFIRPKRVY